MSQKKNIELVKRESLEAVHTHTHTHTLTTSLSDFIFNSRKILNSKNKNSGITLIALIITIIVMLILAGVTISILVRR